MRNARAEAAEAEKIIHPVSGEAIELGDYDRTLADILGDKKEQELFINRYLYDANPDEAKEIADSLASGTLLSPEQTKLLEKVRETYNLRCAQIEKVQDGMTPEELIRIGGMDPRIKEVIGKIGAEKAAEVLGAQFQELALSDGKAFNRMVKSLQTIHQVETGPKAKALDLEITQTLESYGISEDAYFEATKDGITTKTKEHLDGLVAKQFGFFRTSVDWITGGGLSHRGGREMYMQLQDQEKLLAECDMHRKAIGKVLRGTLSPDVNLAMQKYMLEGGSIKEHTPKDTVQTIGDYKKVREEVLSQVHTIPSRWEKYKIEEKKRLNNIRDWSQQPVAFEAMKDRFAQKEIQERQKHKSRGTLGALLAILFNLHNKQSIKNSLA